MDVFESKGLDVGWQSVYGAAVASPIHCVCIMGGPTVLVSNVNFVSNQLVLHLSRPLGYFQLILVHLGVEGHAIMSMWGTTCVLDVFVTMDGFCPIHRGTHTIMET